MTDYNVNLLLFSLPDCLTRRYTYLCMYVGRFGSMSAAHSHTFELLSLFYFEIGAANAQSLTDAL